MSSDKHERASKLSNFIAGQNTFVIFITLMHVKSLVVLKGRTKASSVRDRRDQATL
jgi:uncharacterized protein YhhL (DUF1145 family)